MPPKNDQSTIEDEIAKIVVDTAVKFTNEFCAHIAKSSQRLSLVEVALLREIVYQESEKIFMEKTLRMLQEMSESRDQPTSVVV